MNVVVALLCTICILVGCAEGQVRVSFYLQDDESPNSPIVVNGVQTPELTFKRKERYSLENETPSFTLCIQTQDFKEYEEGLISSCIGDEPVVWSILESTPDTLYYTFLERPDVFVKIHIVDQAPKFRIWYKTDLLSPGSTISYEFSSFPASLLLDLVNSGDDLLQFHQQPLLSSSPQSPYWPPNLPLLPSTLPAETLLPYNLTFEAPFSGTILWESNDVYASYSLSFYISCSCWDEEAEVEVLEVPLLPNDDVSGMVTDIPKENNYNPLMVFLVVPALSLLTVCGTVLLMGVMLGRKLQEEEEGLVELKENGKGEMKRELIIKREDLGDPFSDDEVSSGEEQ